MYKVHEISIYKYYRRLVILSIGAQNPDIYAYTYIFIRYYSYTYKITNGM